MLKIYINFIYKVYYKVYRTIILDYDKVYYKVYKVYRKYTSYILYTYIGRNLLKLRK